MADLRIVDAPLLSTVKGTEKLPTGGEGNFSVSVNQVADFAKLKWFLATEGYVDNAVGNVQADLNLHKNNSSNPHQVTKSQVGLGNVDNTSDLDKPLSNADVAALSLKADKATTISGYYISDAYTKTEVSELVSPKADKIYVDTALSGLTNGAAKFYPTLSDANADIANIGIKDKVEVGEVVNGGTWYKATADATTLTKSPYDPLTQAKNYTDETALPKVGNETKLMRLLELPEDSPYAFAISDQNYKACFLISKDGVVISINQQSDDLHTLNLVSEVVSATNVDIKELNIDTTKQSALDDFSDYSLLINSANELAAIAVKKDGSVIIDSVQSRKITLFDKKYNESTDLDYGAIKSFGGTALTEIYKEENEVKDCFWTWWINPIACRMGRTTYGGGVGMGDDEQNYGDIKVWQQRQNSLLKAGIIGKIETVLTETDKTDDHNAPAILLDPRPDAKYPLTVFQADHSQAGSVTRMWRSKTAEVSGLVPFGKISVSVRVTYSQAYRNPNNLDQIFVIIRHAGNANGDWRILRSDDNGDSWQEHKIFLQAGFYIGSRQSENGITLVFQRNVMSDVDTKVALTELRWDGSLVGFNNEVLIPNVFELTTPVAPFALPNLSVIYESEAGTFRRVFDIREVSENKVQVLMAEFEKSESGATVKQDTSQFVLLTVNTLTGVVTRDATLPNAGNPMEASIQNAYFAGGCILGEDDLLLCRWNSPVGSATGEMSRYTKTENVWNSELLDSASNEICRPHIVELYAFENDALVRTKTNTIVYMSGDYRTFTDMTVSTKIKELS